MATTQFQKFKNVMKTAVMSAGQRIPHQPTIIIYMEFVQYYPIIASILKSLNKTRIYFYSDSKDVRTFLQKIKLPIAHNIYFCDLIITFCNYESKDFDFPIRFFMQSKLVKKVQIFHGITDGIYGYTYQKKLMNYDLLLCSTRHRYDKFLEENFPKHKLALIGFTKFEYQGTQIFNLSSKKKTILFCPTWGIRSSLPFTSGTLLNNLSKRYNVLFSLHVRHSQYWKDIIEANQNITIVDDDCLIKAIKSSDLIISDVSSAAYEALFFKKKVLLIQTPWNEYLSMSLDKNNIEYQLSKKLALNISWRENIEQKINDLLNINEFPNSHQTKTLEDFFHLPNNTNPSKLAAKKILQLIR